jgi:hypothetical protein
VVRIWNSELDLGQGVGLIDFWRILYKKTCSRASGLTKRRVHIKYLAEEAQIFYSKKGCGILLTSGHLNVQS